MGGSKPKTLKMDKIQLALAKRFCLKSAKRLPDKQKVTGGPAKKKRRTAGDSQPAEAADVDADVGLSEETSEAHLGRHQDQKSRCARCKLLACK